jgi:anthranilate synthase/aminodeoxychorismate synthase-like glutamine amidotransferase
MHGRTSQLRHTGERLFADLPSPMTVCRYHSLVVDTATLPHSLRACAWTDDDTIMAITHTDLPLFGVQFHPEAILTENGYPLLCNFLRLAGCPLSAPSPHPATTEIRQTLKTRYQPPPVPVTF